MQLERVERLGSEAWQGVAQVDRGQGDQRDWRWLAALVAGAGWQQRAPACRAASAPVRLQVTLSR